MNGDELRSFGWGILIDTDLDAHDYEFMLMLDGIANPDEIYLAKNTVQENIDDPSDKPEQIEWTKEALSGTDYNTSLATTTFTGDADYFLDFKVPYDIFLLSLGIDESSLIRYFFGTSQSTQQLSADLVGSTLYDGVSDFTLPSGKVPTTGSVEFVEDSAGNGSATQFFPGGTLYIKVIDDDQNAQNSTVESVTISVLAPSGDTEVLVLTETGADTGIFIGSITTTQSSTPSNDGILQVIPVEYISATYIDAADALDNTNQTRTDTIRAKPTADLGIVKTVSNATPNTGDTVTFTLTLTNYGPSAASGIQVEDLLDTDLIYENDNGGGTFDPSSGLWFVPALAVGSSTSLQIETTVTAPAFATVDNTASIVNSSEPDLNSANDSDTITLALTGSDLEVTKTVAVTNPAVGGNLPTTGDEVTYTVTVTNLGSYSANNIVINDLLPTPDLTYLSHSAGATYNSTSGDWTVGTLANGDSATLDIIAQVDAAGGASVTNTAYVKSVDESDPVASNDSASATIYVDAADLQVSKTVDNPTPDVGDTITYTITVENLYGSTAGGLQIQDQLPFGLEFVSATATAGTYDDATGIWDLGATTLSPGDVETLDISATVKSGTAGQVITNTVSILASDKYDPNPTNDDVSIQVRYLDLAVTKTASTNSPDDEDPISFTITVTNNGPIDATGVQVYDKLPIQVYNDANGQDNNENITTSFSDATDSYDLSTWVWDVGDLAAGESDTLTIDATVKVPNGGSTTFFNIAKVEASDQADPFPGNDADSVLLGVTGTDIEVVSKTVDNLTPGPNDVVTYTIQVRNNGPNDATSLTISEALPAGLTYVTGSATDDYTPPTGATDDTAYTANTGLWTIGYDGGGNTTIFPAYNTVTLTLQAEVAAAAGSVITNNALVNSMDGSDTNPANNSKSATITVSGSDLEMFKSVSDATPTVGDTITYTLTVYNNGPFPISDIDVTDLLPSGVTYSSDTSGGNYNSATGLWDLGAITLAVDASATLDITATVDAAASGQEIVNTAEITNSDTLDPVASNNSASTTITVQESDLYLIKTVDDSTPAVDSNVTFTLILGNSGPQDATGIVVTDYLPDGLVYVSSTPEQGTVTTTLNPDDSTDIVWDLNSYTLPKSQYITLEITAQPSTSAGGSSFTNTATITASDNYDPNTSNNSQSVSVTPDTIDLSLSKSVDIATPTEGGSVVFTLTLDNNDASYTATGIQVTDLLPAGLTYVSDTAPAPTTYNSATGIWDIGSVGPMNNVSMTLTASTLFGSAGTTYTNTAAISAADQFDNDTSNNSASVDVIPTAAANLTILKSADKATVDPGETITYTLVIQNSGAGIATGVEVYDVLSPYVDMILDFDTGTPPVEAFDFDAQTSGLTLGAPTYTYSGPDIVRWDINMGGSFAAGSQFTLQFKVQVK